MKLLCLKYAIKTDKPEKALSLLINSGISFSSPRREEFGLSFESDFFSKKRVLKWCNDMSYDTKCSVEGFLSPVFALKRRFGLIFGAVLALFLIYLSTFFVWSVRIEGNSEISDAEIIKLLSEVGFKEGVAKSSVDVNEIQNLALAKCHELSFLSINIHGMVADVVVHERITSPRAVDEHSPYNLVADCDGVIVSSLVLDGQTLFENGDTVYKGQLLVSGLVESTSGKTSLRHARGKVFARTSRTLTFEVPFKTVEKYYTSSESSKGIRILGHSFHKKPSVKGKSYDIELFEEEATLLGIRLPAVLETRTIKLYEEKESVLSPQEAEARAYEEYELFISTELDSAEVIEEVFDTRQTESSFVLVAEVTAIENIATEKKIYTE